MPKELKIVKNILTGNYKIVLSTSENEKFYNISPEIVHTDLNKICINIMQNIRENRETDNFTYFFCEKFEKRWTENDFSAFLEQNPAILQYFLQKLRSQIRLSLNNDSIFC